MAIADNAVVALWSSVTLRDPDDGEVFMVVIVPEGVHRSDTLCVLADSDVGRALVGSKIGEVVRWSTPSGEGRLVIDGIGRLEPT